MDENLSMNTLIQSIFALQFTLQHYNQLATSEDTANLDDDAIEAIGDTQMMLSQAEMELSSAYEDARAKLPTLHLPDYETLCAGFVFRK